MPILDPCAGAIPVYCCNLSGIGGIEYSAGSGINITDHVISNTSPGIQYNAGAGIAIHEGTIYNTLPGIDYAEGTDISINPDNRKISVIHPFTSDAVYQIDRKHAMNRHFIKFCKSNEISYTTKCLPIRFKCIIKLNRECVS